MMRGIAGGRQGRRCVTASMNAVTTSWYSGSPVAPGSLVRSSTAIALVVAGSTAKKCGGGERAEQVHLDDADLLALGDQEIDRLARRLGARAHDHEHALGVRRAEVVEQPVLPAGQLGELVHRRFDDARARARRTG